MVIIHAHIDVKEEFRSDFLQLARMVMQGSKAEEGNISYQLYEDTDNPAQFVILEEWKDLRSIKHHEEAPHFKAFIEESCEMLSRKPVIKRYEVSQKL
ncbi:putative quinol monooxygenase [Mesobacillus zeae]|nr:putative quinol monooxygenase [Mesobacillus zeae]